MRCQMDKCNWLRTSCSVDTAVSYRTQPFGDGMPCRPDVEVPECEVVRQPVVLLLSSDAGAAAGAGLPFVRDSKMRQWNLLSLACRGLVGLGRYLVDS